MYSQKDHSLLLQQKKTEPVCASSSIHFFIVHRIKEQQQQSKAAMISTHAQKRSAADSNSPLLNPGILQQVLSYVGPRHCLFVAPVSRWWRSMYARVERQQLPALSKVGCTFYVNCVPQMTLYSSVFSSPSRVKLAHANRLNCRLAAYKRAAGKYADIATLAAAHSLGMEYTAATMAEAAHCNKFAVVQYLHDQGCPWPAWQLEGAAMKGHLELLRWCYAHGCPWREASRAPYYAVKSGDINVMAWVLQQPGTQLSKDVMCRSAIKDRAAMCEFLHEQHCPWDERSCNAAAFGGHLDLLRWLVDSGCPYDAGQLCWATAVRGSVKVLMYLQQAGILSAALLSRTLDGAAIRNKLAAARWLREQGAQWPSASDWFSWSSDAQAWSIAEGYTAPAVQ
jgi:hypothetical protein